MKVRLTKDFTFESAQTLPLAPAGHKCQKMHGHSFKVEITVEGIVDAKTGWFYDHAAIGAAMRPLVEKLDHAYLNEIPGLENPTIENMAGWFWEILSPQLSGLERSRHPLTRGGRFRAQIMKWFSALLLAVAAVFWNACEMHPASELPREEGAGERLPDAAKAESQPSLDAAPTETAKPAADAKPAEAPKFFPEKK